VSSRTTPPTRSGTTAGPGRPGASPTLLAASAVLAVLAVVGAVLLIGSGRGDSDATETAGAPFGMAHVHGLGLDGDELVAGTHYGAFRVAEDGSVTQVGPTQDFMGFTVVGPGHYLASGHPGAGQDAPPNLGLIESTDGGQTWDSVSLRGEADFHSLEARHGRVYGHSGGRLMVSEDKQSWDERASIALADLAVSPDDPDTVLGTTQQGLAVSGDGGNRFELVENAPALVLITWTDDGTLVGVDPQGVVHVSDDRGKTWETRGTAGGQPAALTARGEAVFVATSDGRIVESGDGGQTFRVRYQEA
jgi:hypothetical protein